MWTSSNGLCYAEVAKQKCISSSKNKVIIYNNKLIIYNNKVINNNNNNGLASSG